MIALRYGSLPIVRRTGGLADTVADVAEPRGVGFVFDQASPAALEAALRRAAAFAAAGPRMREARRLAMGLDFSWEASAREYETVYRGGGPEPA
jgi:starch synthase